MVNIAKRHSSQLSLRRWLGAVMMAFLFTSPAFGVGGGGSSTEVIDLPLPVKNYPATIVDVSQTSMKASRISFDGKTYFEGLLGKAKIVLPFEKVNQVIIKSPVSAGDNNYFKSEVTLRSGEVVAVLFLANSKLYGETSYGKFVLLIQDLKSINF